MAGESPAAKAFSDEHAVSLAARGDTAAFGILVERHQERAIRLAYAFTRNFEEARDVAQDAFVKAFRSLKSYREASRFSTWLYRIVVNQSKDHLRRRKTPLSADDEIFEERTDPSPSALETVTSRETRVLLTRLLEELTFKQRSVITLSYFEGMTNEETAQILGISSGTVKATKFQALAKLKKEAQSVLKEAAP